MTGNVVYSYTKNIYIKFDKNTFVLPLSSVAWMKFDKPNEKGLIEILGLDRKEKAITKEGPNKANSADAKSRAAD